MTGQDRPGAGPAAGPRAVTGLDPMERVRRLTGIAVAGLYPVGSQHRWRHYRATLAGGRVVFAKLASTGLGGVFAAEAHGLRWLAEAEAAAVPEVLGWDDAGLVVSWLPPGEPDPAAAGRFGRDLAALHRAGAARWGAPWPGFIASLPLPNEDSPAPSAVAPAKPGAAGTAAGGSWPGWYAARRLLPYLRQAADAGVLGPAEVRPVEAVMARIADLAGPAEPPARIHGDLWAGNVRWSGGRGWLIDPAAHGGHRETDLAMLSLFGAPFPGRILAAYQEAAPLAPGWRDRVPLHQLHPLLVHACLFGASYAGPVRHAAEQALAA